MAREILASLPGSEWTLRKAGVEPARPPVDADRLQFLLGLPAEQVLPPDGVPLDAARLALRRCWLDTAHLGTQLEALARAKCPAEEQTAALRRLHREGGPLGDVDMLSSLLLSGPEDKLHLIPDRDQLLHEFATGIPAALDARSYLAWADHQHDPTWLGYGEALERIGWDALYPVEPSQVFANYLQANAVERAKRYYDEILPFFSDRVAFSNTLGPRRWALACVEGDRATMDAVLKQNATFSQEDLRLRASDALARENFDVASEMLQLGIQRYRGNESEKQLLGFIPLIPALKDPSHPDHAKALDYFGPRSWWGFVQWNLLEKTELPVEEGVRFLGGDGAIPQARVLIAALSEDRGAFEKAYNECRGDYGNMLFVLVHHLRARFYRIPPPKENPALKPPDIKPLPEMVAEAASQN
jgi:hypothetical protein